MTQSKILFIEDEAGIRNALKLAMEDRGFEVEVAGDAHAAREVIQHRLKDLDVLVLDMRLEDPSGKTGADVALEFYNRNTSDAPEFLIYSGYPNDVNYWKLALKLGAADFLTKPLKVETLSQHIRTLALRRALNKCFSADGGSIPGIVERSYDRSEAMMRFCRKAIAGALASNLGAPFAIFLTEGERTRAFSDELELPLRLTMYDNLQRLVFREIAPSEPFKIKREKILQAIGLNEKAMSADPENNSALIRLEGAACMPLDITPDLKVFLAILSADPDKMPFAEDPSEMVRMLSVCLESTLLRGFHQLLAAWKEREAKRGEILHATARVCLYVGQEQAAILQRADRHGDPHAAMTEMKFMSQDLRITGKLLASLNKGFRPGAPSISMAELTIEALDKRIARDQLHLNGDCMVQAARMDLLIVTSRILQWFAQRFDLTLPGIEPCIIVHCRETDDGSEVTFEDRSWRLSRLSRRRLFDPFSEGVLDFPPTPEDDPRAGFYLPLYLAKLLVERRYEGRLEDRSDDIESEASSEAADELELIGNRLFMKFPRYHQ
jgi:DNA-binding response OmpR family regulator